MTEWLMQRWEQTIIRGDSGSGHKSVQNYEMMNQNACVLRDYVHAARMLKPLPV